MEREGYIADPAIATALYLSREMRRPLLIEGDAGVGKTEIAKVLARLQATELILLQCYEGLDALTPLDHWNFYPRQIAAPAPLGTGGPKLRLGGRGADLRPRLPARASAAAGDHPPRRAGGAADRRDRPRGRRLRGFPPRGACRPGDDPRARHSLEGGATSLRDLHLERHPGDRRRSAPALPLPLHRAPVVREGGAHPALPRAVGAAPPWPPRSAVSWPPCAGAG